jgi:hypothetical protein
VRSIPIVALLAAACAPHTYRADRVGYEVTAPARFQAATFHEQDHLERSTLGVPIDLAMTIFTTMGTDDLIVFGLRGRVGFATTTEAMIEARKSFVAGAGPDWVLVDARAPVAAGDLASDDLLLGNDHVGGRMYIRLFVTSDALYLLAAACHTDDCEKSYIQERRQRFFDDFRMIARPSQIGPSQSVGTAAGQIAAEKLLGHVVY